ncbi:MAG: hypothetical protein GQ532_05625, partial [Methylomarinum sp.]|nr:hypothetical protein [Methylomarinum sp.]
KVFLFELRQIEVQAQRVQGFAFFLRQNPAYQPQEWSESDHIPEIWNQINPLQFQAYADPMDRGMEESLIEIAKKIKTESDALLAKQKKRTLNSVSLNQQVKKRLDIPLYRKQLKAYVVFVRNTPGKQVSALAYRQAFVEGIAPEIWLACVLNECLRQKNKELKIDLREAEHGVAFSGNQKVTDIFLTYQG